jgi:hypothetical protein
MNRKDYISLMEAYDGIVLNKELDDESDRPNPESDLTASEVPEDAISIGHQPEVGEDHHEVSEQDMEENEEEKHRMVCAHLNTLRSHSHEINECIKNGANIEPWMEEKIAIANDYIVHVANAIMYRK